MEQTAADFHLSDPDGRPVTGTVLWQQRPTLLAFYKAACPTCQLALPRVQALHVAYGDQLHVVGIAQESPAATRAFAGQHGLTFPQLCDEPPYPVSRAYGLTHVPTLVLVEPGGRIGQRLVAWDKAAMNELSARLAANLNLPAVVVSPPGDGLPVFKPG